MQSSEEPSELLITSVLDKQGGWLSITVQDNGCGVSEDRLQEVRLQLEKMPPIGTGQTNDQEEGGIGLPNVLSRLRLHFNKTAAMELRHVKPHGFSVTIHIPLAKENER